MITDVQSFFTWLLVDTMPDFLTSEPIVFILGLAVFGYIIHLFKFLIR